jgi:hypothetical protein
LELVRLSQLEKARSYRTEVHEVLWRSCQTLPELLLREKVVCEALGDYYLHCENPSAVATAMGLASIVARELGDALSDESVDRLVKGLAFRLASSREADVAKKAMDAEMKKRTEKHNLESAMRR